MVTFEAMAQQIPESMPTCHLSREIQKRKLLSDTASRQLGVSRCNNLLLLSGVNIVSSYLDSRNQQQRQKHGKLLQAVLMSALNAVEYFGIGVAGFSIQIGIVDLVPARRTLEDLISRVQMAGSAERSILFTSLANAQRHVDVKAA